MNSGPSAEYFFHADPKIGKVLRKRRLTTARNGKPFNWQIVIRHLAVYGLHFGERVKSCAWISQKTKAKDRSRYKIDPYLNCRVCMQYKVQYVTCNDGWRRSEFVNACQSRNLLFFDQSVFIFNRVKIDSYSYDHKILLSSISHVTKKNQHGLWQ